MLRKADMCVENMAPGTIERLGRGYEAVREINPDIIYCQVKGFGTGSPYEPTLHSTGTGMTMAVSVLGAMQKRTTAAPSRCLQVPMEDAMPHYMRSNFATQARSGRAIERGGAHSGGSSIAPSGLFPCAPGGPNENVWIMTSRANPEYWIRLCKVMGGEELIADPRFAKLSDRVKNSAKLDAIIQALTRSRNKTKPWHRPAAPGSHQRGVHHDGTTKRSDVRAARHHATMQHPKHAPFRMPA